MSATYGPVPHVFEIIEYSRDRFSPRDPGTNERVTTLKMSRSAPFDRFPAVRARTPEEMREALTGSFGAVEVHLPSRQGDFSAKANLLDLGSVGFAYCFYPTEARLRYGADGLIRFQMMLGGMATATIGAKGIGITSSIGCFSSPRDEIRLDFAAGTEDVEVRVKEEALLNKLGSLVGIRPRGPLEFDFQADLTRPEMQAIRRLVMFLAAEFEVPEPRMPIWALAEFEQMFIVSLLFAQRHNLSHLLERDPGKALPWQVRRAEEYIEAHWNEPLTVDMLANITGASIRSIFKTFRQARGYSPMEFAKSKRLEHARQMLLAPDDALSVGGVARACGFGNLGHFATDYQRAFGERPSVTLRRARGKV